MSALIKKHSFDAVFDSQKMFRLILDAMSFPAKTVNIKEYADKLYGNEPEMLAVAMTLLDNEVSFHTCENQALSDDIISLTLSRPEPLCFADYIFVPDSSLLNSVITSAKCGSLCDPHKSATIIVKNGRSDECVLSLCGPGIKGVTQFHTTGAVSDALTIRDSQCYEYPQGIDFIFVSENGDLFSIPRFAAKEVR